MTSADQQTARAVAPASLPAKAARLLRSRWIIFWMRFAGLSPAGRLATRLAAIAAPPFYQRSRLASMNPRGYIDPGAVIAHSQIRWGRHIYLGDRVMIYQDRDGGPVEFADRVYLYGDTTIQTGAGGSLFIGSNTHIQPRCQFSAYHSAIYIGNWVQMAPGCAFYPYDHSLTPGRRMLDQPLTSRGPIVIGDDVWLGYNVVVLSGVTIGDGAVIGAGAVVNANVPPGAIAVGNPARVVKMRGE